MLFRSPLLAPRWDGVEFVGSSGKTNGWDTSTSAESERDGDGVMDDEGARVPAGGRTRCDIGLGGCAGNIAREGFAVPPKTAPELGFSSFPKTAHEWRHREDCVGSKQISPSRRSRRMVFNVSFPILPLRAF